MFFFRLAKILFDFLRIKFILNKSCYFKVYRHKKSVIGIDDTFDYRQNQVLKTDSYTKAGSSTNADFTVLTILAAILYGSPLEAGLLSSNHPFHPF